MSKSYIFPGQGSQFVGMGKDIYETNPKAREMMENAAKELDFISAAKYRDLMYNLENGKNLS